ncbi:ATP-binding cassette sub- C member 8, partial [Stylosanthes scabra]|nr:ATP-binding cassette sub- C member 8 [Stylosanthes scabra]
MKGYGSILYWMAPTIVSAFVFLGCIVFHSAPLDAGTIFTVLATLRIMSEPVRMIPEALSVLIQVVVSFDRLNTFLLDEELGSDEIVSSVKQSSDGDNNGVKIEGGNFTWDQESGSPTLADVNLEVKWGHKVAVVGPVGGGKSSLLHAILGEIPKISGN